jgi:hypothetical protein
MTTPQEEAASLFAAVVNDLTAPNRNLVLTLRRCQHACSLLNWPQSDWFKKELNGYATVDEVPHYRRIPAELVWRAKGSPYSVLRHMIEEMYADPEDQAEREPTTLVLWAGAASLSAWAQKGVYTPTGETRQTRRHGELVRVTSVEAPQIAALIATIEQMVFEFASRSYAVLRYGNALTDFWTGYRTQVEAVLQALGFSAHLDAIQTGLRSPNPQEWRNAIFGCRNLLEDLARYLWRDPRQTYEHLPNSKGGHMRVTEQEFGNRLAAYLHQKGLRGSEGRFARDEIERIAVSLRSLIALLGGAHAGISIEDARSAALGTYFIVGEFATKTDMQPITQYGDPAAPVPDVARNQ